MEWLLFLILVDEKFIQLIFKILNEKNNYYLVLLKKILNIRQQIQLSYNLTIEGQFSIKNY